MADQRSLINLRMYTNQLAHLFFLEGIVAVVMMSYGGVEQAQTGLPLSSVIDRAQFLHQVRRYLSFFAALIPIDLTLLLLSLSFFFFFSL